MSKFDIVLTSAAHRERKQNANRKRYEEERRQELIDIVSSFHANEESKEAHTILLADFAKATGRNMSRLNQLANEGFIKAVKKPDKKCMMKERWYITQLTYDRMITRLQCGLKLVDR